MSARLCGVDGANAGCGPCVRPAGHPNDALLDEFHRDAQRSQFYTDEKCPHCDGVFYEGTQIARHLRDEHGITAEPRNDRQLGLDLSPDRRTP